MTLGGVAAVVVGLLILVTHTVYAPFELWRGTWNRVERKHRR